mmetsp:Transcript_14055/g.32556  ORF Transcript_14055/g.32556 Transcript_14055/m.32556 type:complete len:95 (+) Transcript_14055:154-438(+)
MMTNLRFLFLLATLVFLLKIPSACLASLGGRPSFAFTHGRKVPTTIVQRAKKKRTTKSWAQHQAEKQDVHPAPDSAATRRWSNLAVALSHPVRI